MEFTSGIKSVQVMCGGEEGGERGLRSAFVVAEVRWLVNGSNNGEVPRCCGWDLDKCGGRESSEWKETLTRY